MKSVIKKTIGDTTYIVENVISEHARETAYQKVKRLILNDADSLIREMAREKDKDRLVGIATPADTATPATLVGEPQYSMAS